MRFCDITFVALRHHTCRPIFNYYGKRWCGYPRSRIFLQFRKPTEVGNHWPISILYQNSLSRFL